jgi:hypothetical protein
MRVIDANGNLKVVSTTTPINAFFGGRLTLATGDPTNVGGTSAATTLYYTPWVGNYVTLWNGSNWQQNQFSEKSLALGSLSASTYYYIYGYLNSSGDLQLEASTTGFTNQDGINCKSSDHTRVLLGAVYMNGSTQTNDSAAHRNVVNMYNRVDKNCEFPDNGVHTTTNLTYTQVGAVQIDFITLGDQFVRSEGIGTLLNSTGGDYVNLTIGSGSTTEATGAIGVFGNTSAAYDSVITSLAEAPSVGSLITRYLLYRAVGGGTATAQGNTTTNGIVLRAMLLC